MKNKIHLLAKYCFGVVWILFLLQSCFVAKKYKRPEVQTENLYRNTLDTAGVINFGALNFLEVYPDSILQKHIQTALEKNLDLRKAIHQIAIAQSYLKQAKGGYYPQLNLNTQYSSQEFSSGSSTGQYLSALEQYDLSAMLSWEADIWGKIRSNKRSFQASFFQSQEAHHLIQTRIIAEVASAYFQLLALHEKLAISLQTIEYREQILAYNEELQASGIQNQVIVERAKAQLYYTYALEKNLNNQIEVQENALCVILGETPHAVAINPENISPRDSLFSLGVAAELLSNRPDVKAAELGLIQAFEMTNVAKSNFYPSFKISAIGGYQNSQFTNWFSPSSMFYSVLGGLAQPIFNQRRIRSQFEIAKSKQEQAVLEFQLRLLTAGQEVSDALNHFQTALELIQLKEIELAAYNQIAMMSEDLYKSGLVNALEILTARENALNTALEIIDLKNIQNTSLVRLYQALGGGNN